MHPLTLFYKIISLIVTVIIPGNVFSAETELAQSFSNKLSIETYPTSLIAVSCKHYNFINIY